MYIEAVPNRNSPPAILLRESYRHEGKVRKRTLCNLSDWAPAHIEGLRGVLKGGTVIPAGRRMPSPSPAACRMAMSPPRSARPAGSASTASSARTATAAVTSSLPC